MDEPRDLEEIRRAFKRDPLYRTLLSPRALRVLDEIIEHPTFPGASDGPALAMLGLLARLVRPARVLQLGTLVGFSSIVLGDVIAPHDGRLVTVDPDTRAHELARRWVRDAGLEPTVTFIDGASTEADAVEAIASLGPYDLVYLDSSHGYAATLEELELVLERAPWLVEHGLLVLHDAGAEAAVYDPSSSGGVRRALSEWMARHPDRYDLLVFEPPLWPAHCGLGLLTRRRW